jgi:cytochrome c oxidase subunit II
LTRLTTGADFVHKWWSILFGVVMAAAALLFLVSPFMGWWLPKNVSSFGGQVDGLYYLILAITGFFFILTEAILVYNIYRFGEPGRRAHYVHGNHTLEVLWTVVPAAILLLIALLQVRTWEDIKYQSRMPEPDQVLEVSARQFEWRMRYPASQQLDLITKTWRANKQEPALAREWSREAHADDLHVVNGLHTWKDANVRIYLTTRDVLHSFYLPNLRLKQDALPGKTIPVWFRATDWNTMYDKESKTWVYGVDSATGKSNEPSQAWDLACAELCGWGHYKMQGRLYVHATYDDFRKWFDEALKEQSRTQPGERTITAAR